MGIRYVSKGTNLVRKTRRKNKTEEYHEAQNKKAVSSPQRRHRQVDGHASQQFLSPHQSHHVTGDVPNETNCLNKLNRVTIIFLGSLVGYAS